MDGKDRPDGHVNSRFFQKLPPGCRTYILIPLDMSAGNTPHTFIWSEAPCQQDLVAFDDNNGNSHGGIPIREYPTATAVQPFSSVIGLYLELASTLETISGIHSTSTAGQTISRSTILPLFRHLVQNEKYDDQKDQDPSEEKDTILHDLVQSIVPIHNYTAVMMIKIFHPVYHDRPSQSYWSFALNRSLY
jgi:hypothetical protein